MNKQILTDLIFHLTGKMPNPIQEDCIENELLNEIISVKNPLFDLNEFNEVLLIYNKDRISRGFFQFFFLKKKQKNENKLTLKQIEEGVRYFRKLAMLHFGNFIYAYRTLSKLSYEEIENKLKEHLRKPEDIIQGFKNRTAKLQNIKKVGITDIHLLGYLSREGVDLDFRTVIALINATSAYYKQRNPKKFCEFVIKYIKKNELKFKVPIRSPKKVLENYFKNNSIDIKKFTRFLDKIFPEAERLYNNKAKVEKLGKFNFAVYLTWDYMDVYLATSMRRKFEFKNFSQFIDSLFNDKRLKPLKLRYFDPTQSYDDCRVQKGLTEGLMLKRAKCTIYSIQETDTIGKDSELATTLAQGKPVIAYVREINIKKYSKELERQSIDIFTHKIRLLFETFEKEDVINHCLKWLKTQKEKNITNSDELEDFLNTFADKINKFNASKVWNSIETTWAKDKDFKNKNRKEFRMFCFLIAIADKYFYDSRAKTLKDVHPLGLQVNLNTGVANGVLVVRKIDKCAELLYNFLTNQLDLEICYEEKYKYWYLKETISGCIFRVVVDNVKLTNSFWNFYNKLEVN